MLILKKSIFDYKIIFTSSYISNNAVRNAVNKNQITNQQSKSAFYRSKSKILDYAKNNVFNYFITFSVDNSKFDINDFDILKKKILKHFNNFKNRYDSYFKFILVPELGSKNKRLHFHGLIYLSNTFFLKHIGRGIYRDEWFFKNFGANNWQKIKEYNVKCANYVCKYISKDFEKIYSCNYFCSRNLKTSKVLARIRYDRGITTVYQKHLDFLYSFLAEKGFLYDYDYCSVATLTRDQYNDILLSFMYNPDFQRGFKQLCFSDLK